jgi:ribosomal protein L11 methyltransferase
MTTQISATVPPADIDFLSELFFAFGAETVTLTDAKDEPLFQKSPEDRPHWQHTTVHGLFVFDDATEQANNIIQNIKTHHAAFSDSVFTVQVIENKNWVEETQKYFQPQQFGSLWVCPQWERDNFKEYPVIFIEPGLAFGTGTHPTTQLCLTWLATHDVKNKTVVDYGCGSGILALAACAMGANEVYATDHDHQAVESTINNAAYNDFNQAVLHTRTTDNMQGIIADVVVANILANTLITLASTLTALVKPAGELILSGVLREDVDRVIAAFVPQFSVVDIQYQDEWSLIALVKV